MSNIRTNPNGPSINALLDQGSAFEGKLTFEGAVRIDGIFKGQILSTDDLVVGESGKVEGEIEIGTLTLSGEIVGTIKASKKVTITSTGRMIGDITAPILQIAEGAKFQGHADMGISPRKADKPRPQAENQHQNPNKNDNQGKASAGQEKK